MNVVSLHTLPLLPNDPFLTAIYYRLRYQCELWVFLITGQMAGGEEWVIIG